jgi:hypothetical protein
MSVVGELIMMGGRWLILLWTCLPALAVAGGAPCPGGLFSIQAMVTRVQPADSVLFRIPSAGGAPVALIAGGILCEGDMLEFGPVASGVKVEIYEAGQVITVDGGLGAYRVKSGARAVLAAASAYIATALGGVGDLAMPQDRPRPTAARGGEADEAAPIRPIRTLRDLPRQRLSTEARPVLAWTGGVPPYACQVLDAETEVRWAAGGIESGWCKAETGEASAARLIVRDARGRSAGWNVRAAAPAEVPRPAWLPGAVVTLSSADRTAWAIWLWQDGGPEWRLQAVAMLDAQARDEWLARYFLDGVLGELPLLQPR